MIASTLAQIRSKSAIPISHSVTFFVPMESLNCVCILKTCSGVFIGFRADVQDEPRRRLARLMRKHEARQTVALAPCSIETGSCAEKIAELFYASTARQGQRIFAHASEPCFLKHAN